MYVQVLSDSEKRRNYDVTGRVGDPSHQSSGFPQGHGFTFTQGGFRFFFPSGSTQRSDGINTAQFYDEVLVQSHHKPYLLNFYTDFCMQCADVEVIWKALHKVHRTLYIITYITTEHSYCTVHVRSIDYNVVVEVCVCVCVICVSLFTLLVSVCLK